MITSSSELLNPELPEKLGRVQIPVVEATDESLKGFGCLVEKQEDQEIEIVRWPADDFDFLIFLFFHQTSKTLEGFIRCLDDGNLDTAQFFREFRIQ